MNFTQMTHSELDTVFSALSSPVRRSIVARLAQGGPAYVGDLQALHDISLEVNAGEIVAVIGANGAGKTTLISIICGLVSPSTGSVRVGGHDILTEYRAAREMIGLVPQEITIEPFEKVINTVRFSRGLFGKRRDDAYIERVLRALSLWDKRNARNKELSGGMKRRLILARALLNRPRLLILDEPAASLDPQGRHDVLTVMEMLPDGRVGLRAIVTPAVLWIWIGVIVMEMTQELISAMATTENRVRQYSPASSTEAKMG